MNHVYRIYAPFHAMIFAGTIECGIFDTLEGAHDRLVEIAAALRNQSGAEIQWVTPSVFKAVFRKKGQTVSVYYKVVRYTVNRGIYEHLDINQKHTIAFHQN